MDYPKSVPNVGLVNGKFVDENTATGQVGSLIPAPWGNAVTDELLNVIRAGGDEPAENDNNQLLAAIKVIVRDSIPPEKIRTTLAEYGITDAYTKSVTYTKAEIEALLKNMSALPVGAMVPFPKGTVPPGFLEVDGSVQSTATYPDLAAYLGTTFNTGGEGAGNFRLPDSRGEFFRGWDHGRGVDAGRGLGTNQLDEYKSHMHVNSPAIMLNSTAGTGGNAWGSGNQGQVVATGAAGGSETRPRNLAVMWCIKAWNAPANQGNIDIAALVPLAAQATEANQGTAKIATDAQINAGANDATIVTPKKQRLGFSCMFGTDGYVALPTWLGGFILQWGRFSINGNSATVLFPTAFPSRAVFISAQRVTDGTGAYALTLSQNIPHTNSSATFRHSGGTITETDFWWAWGY